MTTLPLVKEDSTLVYHNSHVNLDIDDVIFPNGVKGKHAKFRVQSGYGVVLIARKIVRGVAYYAFSNEHRYVIDRYSLEFPRSSTLNTDVTKVLDQFSVDAELTRAAKDPMTLGSVYPDTGVMTNTVGAWLFEAEDNRDVFAESTENDSIRWMSSGQISGAIVRGEIFCGITLSVWALLQASPYFSVGEEFC